VIATWPRYNWYDVVNNNALEIYDNVGIMIAPTVEAGSYTRPLFGATYPLVVGYIGVVAVKKTAQVEPTSGRESYRDAFAYVGRH
jgi:hypothetical protein